MSDRLYFRQLLAGKDFATADPVAGQMVNFVYLIGDRATGEAAVVDPAYSIGDIIDVAAGDDMTITDVLATHYHPDHIGGEFAGMQIEGVEALLERQPNTRVHLQGDEVEWVKLVTAVSDDNIVRHTSGDTVTVGEVPITLVHTPGHTPGSQCFMVEGHLVAGDTLFLDGCGRTDLPGGDPAELYRSLHDRLAHVPDDAILYPGHLYSPQPSQDMGTTRAMNMVFKPQNLNQWMAMFG